MTRQTAIGILLDASGKTDWEVAQACGIHPTVISRYRTGERKPHKRHAEVLARFFDCPVDTVFNAPEGVREHDLVRVIEVSGPIALERDDPTDWVD